MTRFPGAIIGIMFLAAGIMPAMAQENAPRRVDIARFASGDRAGWQDERFAGETIYAFGKLAGGTLLHARAADAASGLYREMEIDLTRTPIVSWDWALGTGKAGLDPRRKSGDDYPLRLYFVVKRGLFNLDTIAVQYVWSLSQPVGANWPNPFAPGVMQIAVDSGAGRRGQLIRHSRDLRADFRKLFGAEIDRVDVIAIMTDADNAGGVSEGWYGDVWFSPP